MHRIERSLDRYWLATKMTQNDPSATLCLTLSQSRIRRLNRASTFNGLSWRSGWSRSNTFTLFKSMPLLLQRPSAHTQMPDVKIVQKGQVRLFKQVVDVHVQCSLTVLEISLNPVDEQACHLKLGDGKLEKELKKMLWKSAIVGSKSAVQSAKHCANC